MFGDPQPVVVEPPNLCKFKPGSTTPVTGTTSTKALWATKIDNTVLNMDCMVEGFPRVYTEHATGGGLGPSIRATSLRFTTQSDGGGHP